MKKTITSKLALILIIFAMISLVSCDYFIRRELPEIWQDAVYVKDTELGTGNKTFTFVVQVEENTVTFTIHTDAETVGEALLDLGLIEGENGTWGLYVKKVNGITADYDIDQTYWAFYENGEYGSGVDLTKVNDGYTYSFVRTR